MTLGQKIKKLRIQKDYTQKDLADQVHVTFQTISKWEKDENEPDVAMLRELAKLFGCSMDYLLSEDDTDPAEEKTEDSAEAEQPAPANAEPIVKTVIIHQKELHVCSRCKRDIPEDQLELVSIPHKNGYGPRATTTFSNEYYHKECYKQIEKERQEREERLKAENAKKVRNKSFGWGIAVGIVSLGVSLALMLYFGKEVIHPVLAVFLSILIGYAGFADLYCILSGSYISEVFLTVASWSIKFPGIIFSLDLGGLIFLVAMKILFAVLGFLLGISVILLACVISAVLAAVSFPFVLVHNNNTSYADAF